MKRDHARAHGERASVSAVKPRQTVTAGRLFTCRSSYEDARRQDFLSAQAIRGRQTADT